MKKDQLRQFYRQKRSHLTKIELFKESFKIKIHWLESSYSHFDSYHLFLPMIKEREINTYLLLTELWARGKKTYTSKVIGESLIHYEITENTLFKRGAFGVTEPMSERTIDSKVLQTIEAILVPLIVADKRGHRVGYGKGYYDRFLSLMPQALTIGLSSFPLIEEIPDINPYDIPLNAIVTPDKLYTISI